ncbi:hypothetical protein EDD16DRAFT_1521021 [Pisolithus croceorrhizus]|nr:hypothetical protein EV401DRAFT_1892737 [Pisolithus croceorrhizus]KAI6114601.1 hypothetical protein EDD16DRAFT_1521021 [Pisolithus croceorrhizus]
MFVKNSPALQDAVDHILIIFKRLIINSSGLEEAEKLQQWRNAEAVRSIANRTDNVPHMLIGMDKYVHWTENIGSTGHVPTCSTQLAKGKAQATSEEMAAISWEESITQEDDKGEESDVNGEDIEMDEASVKPAHG